MKAINYSILAILFGGILLSSCEKEVSTPSRDAVNNTVQMTVKVDLPEAPEEGSETKLTLDASTSLKMSWDGEETLYVMAANTESGTLVSKVMTLTGGTDDNCGVFSGTLDFGDSGLTVNDIKAVVLNNSAPSFNYTDGTLSVVVSNAQTKTQDANNVLNGIYAAAYALVDSSNIENDGDGFNIDGVSLSFVRPLVRLNIYDTSGKYTSYKVKQVRLHGTNPHAQAMIQLSDGAIVDVPGTTKYVWTAVNLTSQDVLSDNKADGIKIILPIRRPVSQKFDYILVTLTDGTNDIGVVKTIKDGTAVGYTINLEQGNMYTLNMDLANLHEMLEYSTDDGTTWSSDLPTSEFDRLKVRTTNSLPCGYPQLEDIRTAIETYGASDGVDVDLSSVTYGPIVTFPAIFRACTKIKGISFPGNITSIAAYAFYNCTKLTRVELEGLTSISTAQGQNYAFAGCSALTSVTIPSTITSYMDRSFVNCKGLEEIHYNAAWNPATGYNYRTFQWGEGTSDTNQAHTKDLTLYIGENVKNLPQSGFRNNNNITKVVVEGTTCVFVTTSLSGCRYISTFEFKGATPPKIGNTNAYTNLGASVTGDKKIIIPHGATANYTAHANWAAWQTFMSSRGFSFEEAAE